MGIRANYTVLHSLLLLSILLLSILLASLALASDPVATAWVEPPVLANGGDEDTSGSTSFLFCTVMCFAIAFIVIIVIVIIYRRRKNRRDEQAFFVQPVTRPLARRGPTRRRRAPPPPPPSPSPPPSHSEPTMPPPAPPARPPPPPPSPPGTAAWRVDSVEEFVDLIPELPQGFPEPLWGIEWRELGQEVVRTSTLRHDGVPVCHVRGKVFHADKGDIDSFMQEMKD